MNLMNKIGYVVSEKAIKGLEGYVAQVRTLQEADPSLPILIVGWKKAKELKGYKGILERHITDNLFWTFGKMESRVDYERDLNLFYAHIRQVLEKKITYKYVNPFALTFDARRRLIKRLSDNAMRRVYRFGSMIYLLENNVVMGFCSTTLEYCGINPTKLYKRITSNSNTYVVKSSLKIEIFCGDKKYLFPCL